MSPEIDLNRVSSLGATALCLRELPRGFDPIRAFEVLRADPYPWLLDSSLSDSRLGRFSFAGSDPYLVVRATGRAVEIEVLRAVRPGLAAGTSRIECDPFEAVRALLPPRPEAVPEAARGLPFAGGVLGYWGYELAEHTEPVLLHASDDSPLPDLVQLFVDRMLVVDFESGRAFAVGLGFDQDARRARERAERASEELRLRFPEPAASARPRPAETGDADRRALLSADLPTDVRVDFDEARYAKSVTEILEEISAGNVYQADLTHRMQVPFAADPWPLYLRLRSLSPAPFAAYLELPEVAILSSSPERFFRLDSEGCVESRPIKGTRPRGQTPEEDARLRDELARSSKDRAENLMIVDLVRNDLGRVCQTGSVQVPELWAVESYASVFQLVSTVAGRLRSDLDGVDLLRAVFPPGSMTGAPKIAAIQLLDRLEPVRRGVYSGAIGYIDVRGGADLSVVIRTLLVREGAASFHVGGGVVADSDPVEEYRETLDKARALLAALAGAARC